MPEIRTVLCPVDFSAATARQTALAADLCRAFKARLILHHNVSGMSAGMAVGWMWAADHPPESDASADARMSAVLKQLPPDVAVQAHVTHGQLTQSVVAMAGAVEADLVVLSTHGEADEHMSLTENVLEQATCAVLALHGPTVEKSTPQFAPAGSPQVLVVPINLTPGSRAALDFACELTRRIPFELHLVHFLPGRGREPSRDLVEQAERQIAELLPEDVAARAKVHVERGEAAHGIAETARRLSAACIVMGEHTRRPLRRWLSRDTARAVLHEAPCPVWYVPGELSSRAAPEWDQFAKRAAPATRP